MIDPLMGQMMYYFFMQHDVVLYSVGITTSVVLLVSLLTLLKKWGESY